MPELNLDTESVYKPWPKQEAFHGSGARYRLFGGAQGPGKSLALLWEAIFHCLEYPGSNSLLLRRTYQELDANLIDHFRKHVLGKCPQIIGGVKNFNQGARTVRFPNGSVLKFGYCEAFKDVYQYDGGEYVFIGFDELTQFPFRIWEHLRLRNRTPVEGARPCMAGATNPGGDNCEWVKALWIDKKPFPGMKDYQYDRGDYEFIPATVWDNPIYANSAEYIKNLEQMSPALRAQRLEGRWDKFEGQFFTNFDPVRHVWDTKMNPFVIPYWWPKWVGIDWGFAHHTAVYWHARGKVNIDGEDRTIVLTYREMVEQERTAEQLGELIGGRTGDEKLAAIYLSPDAFARKETYRTIAQQMSEALIKRGLPGCAAADNDRVGGWNLMYQLLEMDQWMIRDTCPMAITSLPLLVRDAPEKVEDVRKTDSLADDIGDGLRYGLKSYLEPRKVPREVLHQEKVANLVDPVVRAFYEYRHMLEGEGEGPVRMQQGPRWAQ